MSEPVKHHYVSKFYLKNFTKSGGSKEKLFCYDKTKEQYFESNPKDICFIKNFNTVSYPENQYIIEHTLAKRESVIAKSFKETITCKSFPNESQLKNIIEFIALMFVRNPKTRTNFNKGLESIAEHLMRMNVMSEDIYHSVCEQAGIPTEKMVPYKEAKDFAHDPSRYKISVNQDYSIKLELSVLRDVINSLYTRNWYLIISNEYIGQFITSDFPVSIVSNKSNTQFGVGLDDKDSEVCFPISNDMAFIGIYEKDNVDKVVLATKDIVKTINKRTLYFASKQVYSSSKFDINNL
jgi:hypothetical protein